MKCRKCGIELVIEENWTISRYEKNDYLCYNCSADSWKTQDKSKRLRAKLINSLADHRRRGHVVYGTFEDYKHILTNTCPYCGLEMDPLSLDKFKTGSFDLIDPFSDVSPDNAQWICLSCNMAKGKRTHSEFEKYIKRLIKNNKGAC